MGEFNHLLRRLYNLILEYGMDEKSKPAVLSLETLQTIYDKIEKEAGTLPVPFKIHSRHIVTQKVIWNQKRQRFEPNSEYNKNHEKVNS